jgi:hypothetical protein
MQHLGVLHRVDPARTMARRNAPDVRPDLFERWSLLREWGRVGRGGTMRTLFISTGAEAQTALARRWRAEMRVDRGAGRPRCGGPSLSGPPHVGPCMKTISIRKAALTVRCEEYLTTIEDVGKSHLNTTITFYLLRVITYGGRRDYSLDFIRRYVDRGVSTLFKRDL